MMKLNDFIDKLKFIENQPTVYYSVAGGDWASWNGNSWNFDCVILVKAVLWGWDGNKNIAHGGAKYGSNGVYDDTPEQMINRCSNVSSDFSKLEKGELMYCGGHVGVYVGDNVVIECTTGWGARKVIYSVVDGNGNRIYNGQVNPVKWEKHGKLPYIEYTDEPVPTPTCKHNVGDVVNINGVYVSSDSTDKLEPAITTGTITRIVEGARNPYLLDNGNIGWVNDGCIIEDTPTPTPAPTPAPSVDILDLVRRTIRGDFGNGQDRVNALGENYTEVQHQVDLNYANGTTNWDNVRLY